MRKYLKKFFPTQVVSFNPQIPPLLTLDSKLDKASLEKKEHYFTRFLLDCLRSQTLRSSFLLMEFLSIADQKKYEKLLKEREKKRSP